ncbi:MULTISPECIES: ArsR/SmtB family transcription factor [unclassified Erysipelothrix]|uniref:ArsR/SmtB family transcription factor n=1 Tax=unclassified Erysipelothrix TaxID=2624170 RepID=UPI001376F955|nr:MULTISPECIES: metalloregulator ArsR/SmtB family transcription factor [unclassified Erysipelothrix]MBK2403059.1 ArsR family transcriptional regulator [Erysipelothrix sp. strain 2 (EsS2-6-Brazil)]MBK2404598.1 ArsR family transcriptional regulator [Erysipelothrix sp. strain 2 (EsS2-7-Brazil)]NBA02009.1 metalloregulator ArsR/SmtB family transcription factor [Erysipelothrix rhusiopathiae]
MDQKELEHHEIKALQETLLAEEEYTDLSMLFKMFADPTRLRIFTILSQETVCVDDLAAILGMTQSAVSHQLASLRKMNLVRSSKVGKNAYYHLADSHVMQIFSQALDHVKE